MWAVHLPKRVARELADAPPDMQSAIEEALTSLQHDPHPLGCKKLSGRPNSWRVRVGSYRILYDLDNANRVIVLLKIGPRKDVYRFLR